ncbi:MAG: type II secretion system protein [Proteobacteria bacterium]|nr:type II secretion system protein [Pseudomonadota bacterium]
MSAEQGFSIMEVLVSLALVGIVSATVSPVFVAQSKFNSTSELKALAIDATDKRIDALRLIDPATLPSTGSTVTTVTVGGKAFDIQTSYCVNSSWCSAVTRHLKFTAAYGGKVYYSSETVFTQLR